MYIKSIYIVIDGFVLTWCGYSFIEVIAMISTGQSILGSIDGTIKLIMSILGALYIAVRVWKYYRVSQIEIRTKELDLLKKEKEHKQEEEKK